MKVTLRLKTTPEIFASWLLHETAEDKFEGKLDFPTDEERIVLDPAEYKPPITNIVYIYMFGRRIWRSSEGVETREELPPVVRFVALRLAPELLQVTAECEETAVMDYFEELTSRIAKTFPRPAEEPGKPEEKPARPLPDYFPKTDKARKRWKDAYSIIKKMQREYRRLYRDGDTEKPKPTFDEYRERLGSSKLAWTPSDKTIRRIMNCGDKGLLK